MIMDDEDPERLLQKLETYYPPRIDKIMSYSFLTSMKGISAQWLRMRWKNYESL